MSTTKSLLDPKPDDLFKRKSSNSVHTLASLDAPVASAQIYIETDHKKTPSSVSLDAGYDSSVSPDSNYIYVKSEEEKARSRKRNDSLNKLDLEMFQIGLDQNEDSLHDKNRSNLTTQTLQAKRKITPPPDYDFVIERDHLDNSSSTSDGNMDPKKKRRSGLVTVRKENLQTEKFEETHFPVTLEDNESIVNVAEQECNEKPEKKGRSKKSSLRSPSSTESGKNTGAMDSLTLQEVKAELDKRPSSMIIEQETSLSSVRKVKPDKRQRTSLPGTTRSTKSVKTQPSTEETLLKAKEKLKETTSNSALDSNSGSEQSNSLFGQNSRISHDTPSDPSVVGSDSGLGQVNPAFVKDEGTAADIESLGEDDFMDIKYKPRSDSGTVSMQGTVRFKDQFNAHDEEPDEMSPNQEDEPLLEKSDSDEESKIRSATWDVFRTLSSDNSHAEDNVFYDQSRHVLKMAMYISLFLLVLGSGMISTATLLYASSNVIVDRPESNDGGAEGYAWADDQPFPLICIDYREIFNRSDLRYGYHNRTNCVAVPRPYTLDTDSVYYNISFGCLWPDVESEDIIVKPKGDYESEMCHYVSAQWVWCLYCLVVTPYFFTFLRCMWYMAFKIKKNPKMKTIIVVTCVEVVSAVGVAMLVFRVLPLLDNILQGLIILPALAFVPSLLQIFRRPLGEKYQPAKIGLDILSFLCQASALVLWPIMVYTNGKWRDLTPEMSKDLAWTIPIALLFTSVGFWENYVDGDSKFGPLTEKITSFRKDIRKTKTKLYAITSFVKMVVTLFCLMIFVPMNSKFNGIDILFDIDFSKCVDKNGEPLAIGTHHIGEIELDWVWVWLINTLCTWSCYFCVRAASKGQIQRFSYALPLMLVTPFLLAFLMGGCEAWNEDPCAFSKDLPTYFFFRCYEPDTLWDVFVNQQLYIGIFWWLSQMWITRHIWYPKCERLAKSNKLFVMPLYNGVIIEQSLLHNRNRRDEPSQNLRQMSFAKETKGDEEEIVLHFDNPNYMDPKKSEAIKINAVKKMDAVPHIYFCATMWHETSQEMEQMLKSIFRMDIDQAARRNAQEYFTIIDPDYYTFESHIFFDDAMQAHDDDGGDEYQVNDYVKLLVSTIDIAASAIHGRKMHIKSPVKYATPYGGRLEWTLPGGNKIYAHLKDKQKIRHKKRWSQVMYMYYFLGHKLWDQEMPIKRKQRKADNTFLLALDGDIDFQPIAVRLLVDLMKRNERVGAACGRIHPIGSGPMVWYQQFEYALGHWMQKATEHVLGCVLCSPGCFSLFRGAALMDDNVMNTYTTKATEAKHFVQYDQGEDRWLCTLLLQQGYRVEYCAASDALTYAPETFKEFYNQRRRWGPSTMANIMDLLMSWKETTRKNEDISCLYIMYQTAIFISSTLGPGTIFLMIVGALEVALQGRVTMWSSFLINLVPVMTFVILCYTTKCDTQVAVAFILTGMYAILQMIVLVGITIQMAEQGPCSPPFIFFFYVAGTFVLAAILHPQEFFCVVHGFTYFLAIPSMYMLLLIYSMCNLNVVNWGTREAKQTKTEKEEAEAKKFELEAKKQKKEGNSISGFLNMIKAQNAPEQEGYQIACGNAFSCLCCPREKQEKDNSLYKVLIGKMDDMLDNVRGSKSKSNSEDTQDGDESVPLLLGEEEENNESNVTQSNTGEVSNDDEVNDQCDKSGENNIESEENMEMEDKVEEPRDEMVNPFWIEDPSLGDGAQGKIPTSEIDFFKGLIDKYLHPLIKNKAEEEKQAMALAELKNQGSGAFLMFNAIFVITISVLQLNMDILAVPWPCGDDLRLEPIGFMFLVFFVSIMMMQTFGMIVHRAGTVLHMIATTYLDCERKIWQNDQKNQSLISKDVEEKVALVMDMARLNESNQDDATSYTTEASNRSDDFDEQKRRRKRKTMRKLDRHQKEQGRRPEFNTMDAAFKARLAKLHDNIDEVDDAEDLGKQVLGKPVTRRKSVAALKNIQFQRKMTDVMRSDSLKQEAPSPWGTVRKRAQTLDPIMSMVIEQDESNSDTDEEEPPTRVSQSMRIPTSSRLSRHKLSDVNFGQSFS